MFHRKRFVWIFAAMAMGFQWPSLCSAQAQVLSPSPPNVEYQYQMYFPRWYGWPGPGLALGGSLPSRGREGISSFYGLPMPVPLGSGVYVNSYAYATRLPGFNAFGLAQAAPPTIGSSSSPQSTAQSGAGLPSPLPPAPPAEESAENADIARPRSSNDAAMARSREMQSFGDENLRHQQWNQASTNYRNAIEIAGDNADAHFRLALAYVGLRKFSEAVREVRVALETDPSIVMSNEPLASLLGPDSETVRKELTRNVARWTREDLQDQDRLFLLGAILRFNDDDRSQEVLEAAVRMRGSRDRLTTLLTFPTRNRTIQLTARAQECELPNDLPPLFDDPQGSAGNLGVKSSPKLDFPLPPAPVPQPPEESKTP